MTSEPKYIVPSVAKTIEMAPPKGKEKAWSSAAADQAQSRSPALTTGMFKRSGVVLGFAAAGIALFVNHKGLETQAAADPTANSRNVSVGEMVLSADGQSFVTAARWDNPSLPIPARLMTQQNQKLEK